MYKTRFLEETIVKVSRGFKVVYLSGPRQAGKTTLLKHLSEKSERLYVSLDDLTRRKLAQTDPRLFLEHFPPPVLIDEVQYAPQLFPYIKINVDESPGRGLYWLTGSQQFSIMKNVRESLAGRIGILNLLGFSLAEDMSTPKAKSAFCPAQGSAIPSVRLGVGKLFEHIVRGSFPLLTHRNAPPLNIFYNSYIQTYIDRDLRDIFNVSKIEEFNKFLQLCAARTGQILNYSELARDAGVSVPAAKEWIGILAGSSQIYLLRPYYKNISKRLIKAPKIYFLDTGLAAYLTKWKTAETVLSGAMAGAFFETFVVGEVIKSYMNRGEEPPIYYYRDKEGREVDLIIEKNNTLYPVEIKLSSAVKIEDFRNINYLRKRNIVRGKGALVCVYPQRMPFDADNEIVPVSFIL